MPFLRNDLLYPWLNPSKLNAVKGDLAFQMPQIWKNYGWKFIIVPFLGVTSGLEGGGGVPCPLLKIEI